MEIIESFENYTIKFDGTVTNNKTGHEMAHAIVGGYKCISLRNLNGKRGQYKIHRLLALHFIANPNNYSTVDHIDGNPQNNNLQNLRWVTSQQNQHNQQKAKGYFFHKRDNKWGGPNTKQWSEKVSWTLQHRRRGPTSILCCSTYPKCRVWR